jgi:hypothetical protein
MVNARHTEDFIIRIADLIGLLSFMSDQQIEDRLRLLAPELGVERGARLGELDFEPRLKLLDRAPSRAAALC